MKGVLLDQGSLQSSDLHLDNLIGEFDNFKAFDQTLSGQQLERLKGSQIALTNKVPLDRETLEQLPELRLILVLATGTNIIDLEAASQLGIAVCNNRDYSTHSLVEHTLSLMLALARRLPAYQQRIANGDWQGADQFCLLDPPIIELHNKQLGVIGAGASGTRLATVAQALGMRTVALESNRPQKTSTTDLPRVSLDRLLKESDVISVNCPLTETTRNLIDANALAQMKPEALLINTARGGIINEADLAAALMRGELGGAALDVLSVEPPRDGNPLLDVVHPNLIITPHNAWGSREARQALIDQSTEIVRRFKQGEVMNCVNQPN
ncbi:glycerate dehydrogenase [Litorivivens lipolytica]|uniref:Glycerate dehydrogenase n=1 Tax=Litorivivens lipolytica TaxID=1524264 RepID=A0A7W4W3B4_9GAMM|nr:D-2-hydroxyacid dehydrogenase [Litorivivens lipolytica]MBB3046109.1 glycerate dehydrogenase [Litorivivens lipolytica]